ncbi:MAG: hypothetical protein ACOYL8_00630 [Patescibacteria group bacterium]
MTNIFLSQFLAWAPSIFIFLILILAIFHSLSARQKYFNIFRKLSFKKLVYFVLGTSAVFDFSLVLIQYFVWSGNGFSVFFLPPYQPWSYFISYCFFHFFLANIITLFISSLIFFVFKIYQKYRPGFINNNELFLLFLASLLISWPKIIIFVGLFLGLGIIYVLFNNIILKRPGINWISLILLALILSLLGASYLLQVFNLNVLWI